MSGGMSRRAPELRREAIIDAARELFIQQGQNGASVDAIARRAGVAKGTVYLYFPSKEHIVQAIETQFNADMLERIQLAARGVSDADAIVAWCVELVRATFDQLDTHDMLFYSHAATREYDNPLLDDLTALLAAKGCSDPDLAAAFLLGGTTLIIDRAIAAGDTTPSSDLARTLTSLVRGLIYGRAVS